MVIGPAVVEAAYAEAEQVTRHWARSFHFASSFLPRTKRRAVFALYDYCRHVDNLVDRRGARPVDDVERELDRLAALVKRMHGGERPREARWAALWDTLERYPVPLAPLLELIEGVRTDLGPVRMPDFPALYRYCVQVAGGVGLMLGPVLGADAVGFREYGVGLGVAMQLTNILRDVAEDLADDRIYLPQDELAAYGIDAAILARRRMTPALRRFLAFQVVRARHYFGLGDAVVDLFPADGSRLTVRLMQRTYSGILDQIERRELDVFRGRVYVSKPRKLLILGRTLLDGVPALTHPSPRTS
ncbi:MAG TPA: squalene/phytoene synthase family protein [Gemmatimonadales bacterium]|nr:squalene/phytoene synthase family protein [Gemmatimonadales bacterium]